MFSSVTAAGVKSLPQTKVKIFNLVWQGEGESPLQCTIARARQDSSAGSSHFVFSSSKTGQNAPRTGEWCFFYINEKHAILVAAGIYDIRT
jgi:hypothetical protein